MKKIRIKIWFEDENEKKEERMEMERKLELKKQGIIAIADQIDSTLFMGNPGVRLEDDEIVELLSMVWELQDKEETKLAYELLHFVTSVTDDISRRLLEAYIGNDDTAKKIFLEYFCEYLVDAEIIERILEDAADDEDDAWESEVIEDDAEQGHSDM